MKTPHVWIIFGELDNIIGSDIHFPIDSLVYIANNTGPELYLYTIYELASDSDRFTRRIGRWRQDVAFCEFQQPNLVVDRLNLKGSRLGVSYVIVSNDTKNHLWDYR